MFVQVGSDLKDWVLDSFTWQGNHINKRKHNNGRKAIIKKNRETKHYCKFYKNDKL